ncbi:MAG: TlpA family protein disulfide reductase [Phycisphaerae bacterium]
MVLRSSTTPLSLIALSMMAAPLVGCSQMRGRPAPEIHVGDWINTASSEGFKLADHRGETILLDFWATW